MISSIALAGDHPSKGILRRGVYKKGGTQFFSNYLVVMMTVSVFYQIVVLAILMHQVLTPSHESMGGFLHYDPNKAIPSTLIYNTLFFMQTFQLIAARQIHPLQFNPLTHISSNPLFLFSIMLAYLVQLAFIYLGGSFTRCAP